MRLYRVVRLGALGCALMLVTATCHDEPGAGAPTAPVPPPAHAVTTGAGPAVLVGAGDIATCGNGNKNAEATAKILDTIPGVVMALGDAAADGSATTFNNCYNPTWGRHKARTQPTPGDKEYLSAGAAGYFGYFGAVAGDPAKGYYSFEFGDWHIVVLNSNNSSVPSTPGSAQELWLKADLAASTAQCTLAFWHHPRFFSDAGSPKSYLTTVWNDLYGGGAELVINAHTRNYERFAPQKPDGTPDPTRGIREIVVGTGGLAHSAFGAVAPNSEVRDATSYGVLKLTLNATDYTWQFIPTTATGFSDSGSGVCHGGMPPIANPAGPYQAEGSITFNGTASSDPQGDLPLTYAWTFGDGTTGTGATPTHAYATDGSYTVTLVVTDSKGNASDPSTTSVTIQNFAPTVDAGTDERVGLSEPVILNTTFTDPGSDAPWTYTIAWGDGTVDAGSTTSKTIPLTPTHTYAALADYVVTVTVTDARGGVASDHVTAMVRAPSDGQIFVGAGDIGDCTSSYDEQTAALLDAIPGTVYTLGDNAYPQGADVDYVNCYDPNWGRHKARTRPSAGNHDYMTPGAPAYFNYFGAAAGDPTKGYYSYDLGAWHLIALNSNIPMNAGSPQEQWLQGDLAASTKRCTIAYWHAPRFYSGSDAISKTAVKPLWDDLYAAGAELVLNGHQHNYERMAPQTPTADFDRDRGLREIIVGTGGVGTGISAAVAPNSEVHSTRHGLLKFTLYDDETYTWEFVPVPGATFTDSGAGKCH